MRHRLWFSLGVLLQIIVLIVMIGTKWSTLAFGTKIMLKTQPVDPWDPFRGDYVTLNYEISTLDLNKIASDTKKFTSNQTIYVVLEKQGKYWGAKAVRQQLPNDGDLAIKGTVGYFFAEENRLQVNYGLDSYYVPEGEGRKLENRAEPFDVEVAVDEKGDSALSRLFLQGEEIRFE